MGNTLQITPEIYEQVKAMVLQEIKATNKARAEERQRARKEEAENIRKAFEPIRLKYTPLLSERFGNSYSPGKTLFDLIDSKLDQALRIAVRTLGFYSLTDVYRNNKADEANKLASQILDTMIKK